MINKKLTHKYIFIVITAFFVMLLSTFSGFANEDRKISHDTPETCIAIKSPLRRLSCFDEYFNTPIHIPEKSRIKEITARPLPKILKTANRMEKQRFSENYGLLKESSIEYEDVGQERVILTAPALGRQPPRPILIISCINNITRLQIGLHSPLNRSSLKVTLHLNDRTVDEDYHWRVLESGQIVDAGHGIHSIRILKKFVGKDRMLIKTNEHSLEGLTFDISDFTTHIKQFRKACHW